MIISSTLESILLITTKYVPAVHMYIISKHVMTGGTNTTWITEGDKFPIKISNQMNLSLYITIFITITL